MKIAGYSTRYPFAVKKSAIHDSASVSDIGRFLSISSQIARSSGLSECRASVPVTCPSCLPELS